MDEKQISGAEAILPPPPVEEAVIVPTAPENDVPRASVAEQRAKQHLAELRAQTAKAIGTQQIHTRLDESRKVWQAWAGGGSFAAAEWKGEWNTEAGALRRLRNRRSTITPEPSFPTSDPRPMPARGDTQAIDAVMLRRQRSHQDDDLGIFSWLKRAGVIALLLLVAFGAGVFWVMERNAVQPPRPTIAPAAFQEAPSEPVTSSDAEPPSEPQGRRVRRAGAAR